MKAVDRNGFTPIMTAADCGNYDAFNAMVAVDKGRDALKTALFEAAKNPNVRALKVTFGSIYFI